MEEFSWTRAQTSLIFSLHMGVYAFSAFFWGWMSDRLAARTILSLGCAIAGVSVALMYFCQSLNQAFLFFSILTALGMGAIYVPGVSTIGKLFTKKRGLALGIVSTAIGLSYVWSPIAERLIHFFGWRGGYFVSGILLLGVGTTFSWGLIRSTPEKLKISPLREKPKATKKKAFTNNNPLSLKKTPKTPWLLGETKLTLPMWYLNFMYILAILGLYITTAHLVPYLTDMGINPAKAASALAFIGIFSVIGRLGIGAISDKIGKAGMFFLSFTFQGIGIGLFFLVQGEHMLFFYLGTIILGIGYGGWVPQFPAIIADIYGPAHIGKLIGINTFFGTLLGATLGPWLGGYIYDITGTYVFAFLIAIGASFATLILSIFLFKYLNSLNEESR